MTWQDRLNDAVIETANGDRFVFEFQDVSNFRKERTEIFEFSNTQDYVQRRVSGSQVFDWIIKFSGPDCDKVAETFERATEDPRPLILHHPLKRKSFLVQMLSLLRNDRLKTEANQVFFGILLHETIDLSNIVKPENINRFVDNTVNQLNEANSDRFANVLSKKPPNVLDKIKKGMDKAVSTVAKAAYAYSYAAKTLAQLNAIVATAERLVTTLETNAKAFADLQQGFIQFMSKALVNPLDRLNFYRTTLEEFEDALSDPNRDPLELQLNYVATVAGLCLASISADEETYITKIATFNQAENIFTAFQTVTEFTEDNQEDIEATSEEGELLNQIVKSSAGKLSEIAFRAKQERSFVLTHPSELYSIVYKKIGAETPEDLDKAIDDFIAVNEIGGRELFEMQPGRVLRYYV